MRQTCFGMPYSYFSLLGAFGCATNMSEIWPKPPNSCDYSVGNLLWINRISGRMYSSDDWAFEVNLTMCPDVLIDEPCVVDERFAFVSGNPEYVRRCELIVSSNCTMTNVTAFVGGKTIEVAFLLPQRRILLEIRKLEYALSYYVDLSRLEKSISTLVKSTSCTIQIVECFDDFLCSKVAV